LSDAVGERLGIDWRDADGRLKMALTAVSMMCGFAAGLRGEEIVRMGLGAIRKDWNESMEPHVPLMLVGHFKQEIGEKLFCQPLALKSKSGLQIRLWMFWLIGAYNALKVVDGSVFWMAGKMQGMIKRAHISDLDPMIHAVLKQVQLVMWLSVIPDSVDIESEYSMF
jgi:hypothetical protein